MELIKKKLNEDSLLITFGKELGDNKEISGTLELDIENQSEFMENINSILDDGINNIILNLCNITYIDSSGLWALFECHKKTSLKNGKIIILSPKKDVSRVLDITKMSSKINVLQDEKKAILALSD